MARLLLPLLCALPCLATATEGASYLKIPQGARSTALGGAAVALRGGAEAMWFTPAGLNGLKGFEASLSRMAWIGQTKNDFLALAVPFAGRHVLGAYANLLGTEDIYRDSQGAEGGKFSNSALTAGAAYALSLGSLSLGLGAKFFQERIEALNGSGAAFDAGAQFSLASDRLRLGAAAQNLGSGPSYPSVLGQIKPPVTYRAGASLQARGALASLEYRILPESGEGSLLAGLEYAFKAGALGLAARAGYEGAGAAVGDLAGLTLGGGFEMGRLRADFAWLPQGVLGSPYRLSMSYRFQP